MGRTFASIVGMVVTLVVGGAVAIEYLSDQGQLSATTCAAMEACVLRDDPDFAADGYGSELCPDGTAAVAPDYPLTCTTANAGSSALLTTEPIELVGICWQCVPVTESWDFQLLTSGNISAQAGASVRVAVQLQRVAGSNPGEVTLTSEGFEDSGTASWVNNTDRCTPTCSTELLIATDANARPGPHRITVRGTGESDGQLLERTTQFTLTVVGGSDSSADSSESSRAASSRSSEFPLFIETIDAGDATSTPR